MDKRLEAAAQPIPGAFSIAGRAAGAVKSNLRLLQGICVPTLQASARGERIFHEFDIDTSRSDI